MQITEEIDWTELEELVQAIRPNKLKNAAGRRPIFEHGSGRWCYARCDTGRSATSRI